MRMNGAQEGQRRRKAHKRISAAARKDDFIAMETMTVTAPDISCEHCRSTIEGAVGALPGVGAVHVAIPMKTVQVSYDPARVSRRQIEAALDEEGYPVAP